jgi:hypothetical protein
VAWLTVRMLSGRWGENVGGTRDWGGIGVVEVCGVRRAWVAGVWGLEAVGGALDPVGAASGDVGVDHRCLRNWRRTAHRPEAGAFRCAREATSILLANLCVTGTWCGTQRRTQPSTNIAAHSSSLSPPLAFSRAIAPEIQAGAPQWTENLSVKPRPRSQLPRPTGP